MRNINIVIQALLLFKGITRKKIYEISNYVPDFNDEEKLIFYMNKILKRKDIPIDKNIFNEYLYASENLINEYLKKEIYTFSFLDEQFPNRLKLINNPPALIYAKGNLELLNNGYNVAVVGTRKPTEAGIEAANRLATNFSKRKCNIISGLATGCDEIAHKATIEQRGYTLAVLPSGLDNIYPKSNYSLAMNILESNGLLVSEYMADHKPFKSEYVERDRLQSAFSEAVIVVETDVKGGTMHTANFAINQNKILACFRHTKRYANEEKTKGNQKLISENKAFPIGSKKDIDMLFEKIKQKYIDSSDNYINKNYKQLKFSV